MLVFGDMGFAFYKQQDVKNDYRRFYYAVPCGPGSALQSFPERKRISAAIPDGFGEIALTRPEFNVVCSYGSPEELEEMLINLASKLSGFFVGPFCNLSGLILR